MIKKAFIVFFALILLFSFGLVLAQSTLIEIENPLKHETFGELIGAIIDFIFWTALVLTTLMVIIGAFYILTAGGDPKRVDTGRKVILYTVIGFTVILFSRGLIAVVKMVLGAV